MRRPFFPQQNITSHIKNLQLLINASTDPSNSSRYKLALEAMQIIEKIDDERAPLFTKAQIDALFSIPEITRDWSSILIYVNQREASLERQELLRDFLVEVTRDRNNAKQNILLNPSFNKEQDTREWDRLSSEVDLLHRLCKAIYNISNPVPEFAAMADLIKRYANFQASHEDLEFIMLDLCKVIANANNPKLALQQALRFADVIDTRAVFFWKLKPVNQDNERFNQFLDEYRSKVVSAHQYPR